MNAKKVKPPTRAEVAEKLAQEANLALAKTREELEASNTLARKLAGFAGKHFREKSLAGGAITELERDAFLGTLNAMLVEHNKKYPNKK